MIRLQRPVPTAGSLRRKADDRSFVILLSLAALPAFMLLLLPPARSAPELPAFVTAFFGILVDALPFLIVGSLVSVIVHEFVPAAFFRRLLNRRGFSGILVASFSGLLLPLCECGIVPLVKTLLKAGVRPAVAFTALFAMPLCNPIVVASTFYAFSSRPLIAWERLVFGWIAVVVIGSICLVFEKWFIARIRFETLEAADREISRAVPRVDLLSAVQPKPRGFFRAVAVFEHGVEELYATGRFLIAGALIAAMLQVFLPLPLLNGDPGAWWPLQVLALAAAAFVMSLCSASDAFVARGLLAATGHSVVLGFLLSGALLQLRTCIALIPLFRKAALPALAGIVVAVVFACVVCARLLFGA